METKNRSGFEELQHTADWALRVWAPNPLELLQIAVVGMLALMGVQLSYEKQLRKEVMCSAGDLESLLVGFLNEILFWIETEGIDSDHFELTLTDHNLTGYVECAPVLSLEKEIKAVTFHDLRIVRTSEGYETKIVFDV